MRIVKKILTIPYIPIYRRLDSANYQHDKKLKSIDHKLNIINDNYIQVQKQLEYEVRKLREAEANNKQILEILKSGRDNIPFLKNELIKARKTKEYKDAYIKKEPLVTIRIATYNKAKELTEICLPSILSQTYKNIEIIIVGDHCTDDTEDKVKKINDKRITFINLPRRSTYPENPEYRWMVAGSPGMNIGAMLAKGDWIAPIDDDDEFTTDHVEKLINLAKQSKAELVYGALEARFEDATRNRIVYSETPVRANFSFQGAIYPKALGFFEYDQQSWVVREPGDWNLCRRMLLSGVSFASTKDVVGYLNVVTLKDKKDY